MYNRINRIRVPPSCTDISVSLRPCLFLSFSLALAVTRRLTSLRSTWTVAITVYNTVPSGIAVGAIRAAARDNTDFISANELASRHSARPFVWLKPIKVFSPLSFTRARERIRHWWTIATRYRIGINWIRSSPRNYENGRHSLEYWIEITMYTMIQ